MKQKTASKLSPLYLNEVLVKKLGYTPMKTMTILTIYSNFDEALKNKNHLDFRWRRIPRLQNTVGPSRVF